MKRKIGIAFLLGLSVVSFGYTIWVIRGRFGSEIKSSKPNILVVSVCSLRRQLLSLYGASGEPAMPAVEKFFTDSQFRFLNVFNGLSWTAIFSYTMPVMRRSFLEEQGYRLTNDGRKRQLFRIPNLPSDSEDADDRNEYGKNFGSALDDLKRMLTEPQAKPFFTVAHFMYLHYPFIDTFNKDSEWDYYLSQAERARVDDLLAHPEKYFRKLPLLILLANDSRHILAHPRVKRLSRRDRAKESLKGLLTNEEFLRDWERSPDYADDLVLLEKIYRANARYLDKKLEPLLNLYGNAKLRANTIVMFTGDHGEMHMERGELTHGLSVWDEALHVPMAVRFPNDSRPRRDIERQTGFPAVAGALREMVKGKNSNDDFEKGLGPGGEDVVIARNCMNTIRGLRLDNRYKYFVRIADGKAFLFDLQTDPGERLNLAEKFPEKVSELESSYWAKLPRFTGSKLHSCKPW